LKIEHEFTFEAAHRLQLLPEAHKCHNLHGHNYKVVVVVDGPLEPMIGWVQDYAVIEGAFDAVIKSQVDHKYLNDVLDCHTTAENLAIWIYNRLKIALPWLSEIRVHETPPTCVIYRGEFGDKCG